MNTHDIIVNLLQPFIGLMGAPIIQQFVEFLKVQFRLPIYLTPWAALFSAILFNEIAALYLQQSTLDAFIIGIFSGFLACGWHEITK